MSNIHYLAHYGNINNNRNLDIVPAGITKSSYIISALKKLKFNVTVFSTSRTKNRFKCHYKRYKEQIDRHEINIYINTFGSHFKLLRGLSIVWMWVQVFNYIVFEVKTGDYVLVYHSCSYKYPLNIARLFKKFFLIQEVEEIYNAALGNSKYQQQKEINYLKKADAYLLVNDLMANICGFTKPFIVSYGSYNIPNNKAGKHNDGYIHLVYAGVIERKKRGAFIAVESARYLSNKYKLHILGFGQEDNINYLKKNISEVNEATGRESVIYHGNYYGQKYTEFLSKCHIGLSTHTMEGDFVDLTFPSKILVYIAHNLIPVCSLIPCVEKSKVAEIVVFYRENTPESVANAIISIDIFENNISSKLIQIEKTFLRELKGLLE